MVFNGLGTSACVNVVREEKFEDRAFLYLSVLRLKVGDPAKEMENEYQLN